MITVPQQQQKKMFSYDLTVFFFRMTAVQREKKRIPHQSQSRRGQRFERDNCIGIITTTTGARPDYTHRLGNSSKKRYPSLSKLITERCPTQVAAATGGVWTTDEPTSWEWFLFYFFGCGGEKKKKTRKKAQVHLPGVIGSLFSPTWGQTSAQKGINKMRNLGERGDQNIMRVEEGNESEKNIKGKKTPFFFNWFLKTLLFNETSAPSRVKKRSSTIRGRL